MASDLNREISRSPLDFTADSVEVDILRAKVDGDSNYRTILRADGNLVSEGVPIFACSNTDVDAQNNTLSAAQIAGGLVTHTSVSAGGTVTLDTGANIGAGIPDLNVAGRYMDILYINDGTQVLTFASDTGATVADTGQTIAADEAALIRVLCTDTDTFTVYLVGA